MDKDQQNQKDFLEQQLQWSKEHACILDEINVNLHEMKKIAEYARSHKLTTDEIERLNNQLNDLKCVIHSLEKKLYSIIH